MFPSKADRILARYRPIAPKPPPPSGHGSFASTDPSSTCASVDSFASSSGKGRRLRKRRNAPTNSGNSCKKPKLPGHLQVVSAPASNNLGASMGSLTVGTSDGIRTVPDSLVDSLVPPWTHGSFPGYGSIIPSQMAAPDLMTPLQKPSSSMPSPTPFVLANSLVEKARFCMVSDALKSRPPPQKISDIFQCKDVRYVERAAASSSFAKGVGDSEGGFTKMIIGITHLPSAADVRSLIHARSNSSAAAPPEMLPTTADCQGEQSSLSCAEVLQQPAGLPPPSVEDPCCHGNQTPTFSPSTAPLILPNGDDNTLLLLPNVPSKLFSASSPVNGSFIYHASGKEEKPSQCGSSICKENPSVLFSVGSTSALVSGSGRELSIQRHTTEAVNATDLRINSIDPISGTVEGGSTPIFSALGTSVDQLHLEQFYGSSAEPVLLLDQDSQALWFNKAYDRALKSAAERLCNMAASTGPYIDPLGHPTPLGSFIVSGPCKPTNATLWGFLKKLVIPETEALQVGKALESHQHGSQGAVSVPCASPSGTGAVSSGTSMLLTGRRDTIVEGQESWGCGRLTAVTLESITEVHTTKGVAIVECIEIVEARLGAAGGIPAFITDCTSRVRWVNAAFKHMLGCPEQSITTPVLGSAGLVKSSMVHEPPELTFVCSAEKIPRTAWAFSGRVNLEWTKAGKRRSMTVPCDVSRLVTTATWVWKFDVALSLSLNVPA